MIVIDYNPLNEETKIHTDINKIKKWKGWRESE